MKYSHIVLGGTFDHIHIGHETLLSRAFAEGNHVTIGLTSDAFVAQKKPYLACIDEENISGVVCPSISTPRIQSFELRKKQLTSWLTKQGVRARTTIVSIDDPYGPTLDTKYPYDAIVVSKDTLKIAQEINKKRYAGHMPKLAIITVPMVSAEDNRTISSTRVRSGEIDTTGRLILPIYIRKELTKPFGALMDDGNTESIMRGDIGKLIIAVGDKTTKRLLQNGLTLRLAIIDFTVERKPFIWEKEDWDSLPKTHVDVQSGPGYISTLAIDEIKRWAKTKRDIVLIVNGEEDLLVLPVIMYAPIGSILYYGQPKQGLVRLVITKKKKEEVAILLRRFTS